jgi:hypothetical protein
MDLAYDHIQEESYPEENTQDPENPNPEQAQQPSLNSDIQEAYRAISSSVWGARIGGFLGTVVKQVNLILEDGRQSYICDTTNLDRARMSTAKLEKN